MITLSPSLFSDSALRDLTPEQMKKIESCASSAHFRSGDVIFERGKDANKFFLILMGQVTIEIYTPEHGGTAIQKLGPGELCGTSWMTPPYKWKMDARAATNVEAVAFNAYNIKDLIEKDHELGYAFMRSCFIGISHRLESTQNQLLSLLSRPND